MINVYIVDFYNNRNSGLDTYVSQLGNKLAGQKNVKLHFIWVNCLEVKVFTKKVENGITYYYLPQDIGNSGATTGFDLKATEYLVAEMANKIKIIVHFNWTNHFPFAYLLKQKIKCKTILTKHCIPWKDFITNNYQTFFRLNKLYLNKGSTLSVSHPVLESELLSYHAMDHIICVTQSGKYSLKRMLKYRSNKISVIYNGIEFNNLSKRKRNRKTLRKKYGFGLDEQLILFAGAITERKGAFDLAKAFDKLATRYSDKIIRLIFAGAGDHNKLLDNVKSNWAKITITGKLSKKQLYDFYVMADIGIVPSYVEQCSYTTIEMMCMGLPIIVADVDGLKEIVPDNCGLKMKLKIGKKSAKININDLNDKILFFNENKNLAEEYGVRAKKYALKQFSAQRMVEQTIQVYKGLFIDGTKVKDNTIKEQPIISVILPCYNAEKYIDDCLKSILCQTWKNFELIIIDDGSTDHTASIIKSYDDSRIRHKKNKKNKGIVYSLNKGTSLAKGDYIARIDADDMMREDRLEKQLQYLEKHTDTALVGSWHYIIDNSKKIIGLKQYFTRDDEIKLITAFKNPFSHTSIMLRLNVLNSIGYNQLYHHCEDYDLWTKIVFNYKVANIPECLTYHRVHETNNQRKYLHTQRQSALELQSDIMDEWGVNPTVEELLIHAKINTNQSRQYFNSEEKLDNLTIWISKLLVYQQNKYNYPISLVNKMREYLVYDHCGITPTLVTSTSSQVLLNTLKT